MKKGIVLPTNEMKESHLVIDGSFLEEIPPNGLDNPRISELAFQAVFMFQPESGNSQEGGAPC